MTGTMTAMPETHDDLRAELAALRQMPAEQLVALIKEGIQQSLEGVRKSAKGLRALIDSGKEMDWIIANAEWRPAEISYLYGLREVAFGKMLPDVLHYYTTRPKIAITIGKLSTRMQQELMDGGTLPFRVYTEGKPDVRTLSAGQISNKHLEQLFTPEGLVRDLGEQDAYLAHERALARPRMADEEILVGKHGRWRVDKLKRGAWKNGKFYPESEFRAILHAMDE